MPNQNYDRNAAAVSDSISSLRADYSGLTTTSSFRTAANPQGGGTASATAGAEYGEVDTSNVVSHYIPALRDYKIIVWRICGALSATGAASTTVTFEAPTYNGSTTFYEVGRIAAAVSTAAAFEEPLVASAQPIGDGHKPMAVGFPGTCVKVKLAGTSISAVPITIFYSYVKDTISNQ